LFWKKDEGDLQCPIQLKDIRGQEEIKEDLTIF